MMLLVLLGFLVLALAVLAVCFTYFREW